MLRQAARMSSQFLCSAYSQARGSPLHAVLQQAKHLGAIIASSDNCRQPLPGRLANLAVGGITAGIVAANLEEVPPIGRMQLQINWPELQTANPGMVPKPKLAAMCPQRQTHYHRS